MTPTQQVLYRVTLEEWGNQWELKEHGPYGQQLDQVAHRVCVRTGISVQRCVHAAHVLRNVYVNGFANPHYPVDSI